MTTPTLDEVNPLDLANFLIERKRFLPKDIKDSLRFAFGNPEDIGGSEDFDLHGEVVAQLKAVKALRQSVISDAGVIVGGARDTKEALSSTTSLLTLLNKIQNDIYNQNRIRAVQKATIEILKELDPELQARFITLLEKRLSNST